MKIMEHIKGITLKSLSFSPKKLGDFLYHEGPLLSHFVDENRPDDHYLYRWVDSGDEVHRWLIFKVSEEDLLAFFEQKTNLKALILSRQTVTVLDLDNDLNKKQIQLIPTEHLPENYLPSDTSTFKEKFYDEYALKLRKNIITKAQEQSTIATLLGKVDNLEKQQNAILEKMNELLGSPR